MNPNRGELCLEAALGRELKTLIEHYEQIQLSESEALQRFRESGVKCAGSFPLYYCVQARPFHTNTKQELYALLAVTKRLGVSLPTEFLQQLATLLQFSDLAADFGGEDWNINLFGDLPQFRRLFQHLCTRHGLPRAWTEGDLHSEYQRNFHLLFPDTFSTARFGHRRRLQLIFLHSHPWSCDLPFCANIYDGRLHETATAMTGDMSLSPYKLALQCLSEQRSALVVSNGILGKSTELPYESLLNKLADTVEQRLAKYQRRRFTVANAAEVLGFVRLLRLRAEQSQSSCEGYCPQPL